MRWMEKRARPHACALAAMAVLGSAMAMGSQNAAAEVTKTRLAERVQLQRNAPRGLEYVQMSDPSAKATQGRSSITARVGRLIHLDGNPIDNSYSGVLPMDPDRDGKFSFVHWNGHRIMRMYGPAGSKVWQVTNGAARKRGPGTSIHCDNAAILDLNGDRKNDILHCWQCGSTGKESRHVVLTGQSNLEGSFCRLAAYRKQSDKKPINLVGHGQPGGSSKCGGRNWYWNLKGNKIQQVRTNNSDDQWFACSLLFYVDPDGTDELVTWGQGQIVVGELN